MGRKKIKLVAKREKMTHEEEFKRDWSEEW
jgi:hypothetical protein